MGEESTFIEQLLNKVSALAFITVPETDDIIFMTDRLMDVFMIPRDLSLEKRRELAMNDDALCPSERSKALLSEDNSVLVESSEYSPTTGRFYTRRDSTLVLSDRGSCHLHLLNDVTEMFAIRDEEEQHIIKEAEAHEKEARRTFLVNMSHDLRSHLNTVMGMAALARSRVNDDPYLARAMDKIERASSGMISILDDILDLSGLESFESINENVMRSSSAINDEEPDLTLIDSYTAGVEALRRDPGRTILLVEDIDIHRDIIKGYLSGTELDVVTAVNGSEAVDAFRAEPDRFSLILMDVHMPVMGGYEAARRIRELPCASAKSVPIIAMTANALAEDEGKSFASGMNAHITKPIIWADLISMLAYYLKGSQVSDL